MVEGNDADASTIRDYLTKLLLTIWQEGEGFSGKRPFGNSGWESEIYVSLVKAKRIDGHIDEDGYLDWADEASANILITEAILTLGAGS